MMTSRPVLLLLLGVLVAFALAACSNRAPATEVPGDSPTATANTSPTNRPATPLPTPAPGIPAPNGPNQDPRNGPWNRDVALYKSSDGITFVAQATLVERAGVPCLISDSRGRLVAVFQWFPFENKAAFDRVATSFSTDHGATWTTPAQVEVGGFPETLMRPFDPTIVQLADGRYRLYFTSNERTGQGKPAIYSAIGIDAVHFTFETGARFAPEAGTVDASVVLFQGTWHLFAHNQQANTGIGFHATSADGLSFESLAMVDAGRGRQWIGNAVVVDGQMRYFGSGQGGVWSATSANGISWTVDAGVRVIEGGDPSAVILPGGDLLLAVVGALRADAGPAPR